MNKRVFVLLGNGFEESEAIVPIDILRRAGVEVVTLAVGNSSEVTGSHSITVIADGLLSDFIAEDADMVMIPGGPGAKELLNNKAVCDMVVRFANHQKWVTAICAAPMIPGEFGLLKGQKATSYPGYGKHLKGAEVVDEPVVVSGRFITAHGAGASFDFGLEMVRQLLDDGVAIDVAQKMMIDLKR